MRVPWTARRLNHSIILQEISPEYSLEGLILKLKLQYFGHLMRRANLLEKTMMLGKIEGQRRRQQQRTRRLGNIIDLIDMNLNLLLGRKAMTNLDGVLKRKDITLLTKVHIVKAMAFPVVMYECESWTIKKAERRINAFELWCWRRLLRVPRTVRRSNQSILKEISPEFSLEGLMLKLKLQYFGHLMLTHLKRP